MPSGSILHGSHASQFAVGRSRLQYFENLEFVLTRKAYLWVAIVEATVYSWRYKTDD